MFRSFEGPPGSYLQRISIKYARTVCAGAALLIVTLTGFFDGALIPGGP